LPPEDISYDLNIYLNGAASSDNTGNIVYYYWEIVTKPFSSGAYIQTQNTLTPNASMVIPSEFMPIGQYVVKLVVRDEYGLSDEDTIIINVQPNSQNLG